MLPGSSLSFLPRVLIPFTKAFMPRSRSTHSVLDPQCPSRVVLDRIADKWTALIIQVLARGTMRYAALRREIGGISQKMLTQTLRSLERDGLVQRKVHPVIPPRVDYALTRLGRTLIEPLQGLCRWSEKHLPELQANRARAALKMPQSVSSARTPAAINAGRNAPSAV